MNFRSRRGGLTVVCLASCLVAVGFVPAWADKFVSSPGAHSLTTGHVAILGQVARSGVYELHQGGQTLAGLVQLSGGPTAEASGNVRVFRKGRGGFQTFYSPQVRYDLMDGDILVFDRRQQSAAGVAVRAPGGQSAIPQRGADSAHVTIAIANLIGRPVVLDLPPEFASLRAVLQQLRQPLPPNASLKVISPGRGEEVVRVSSASLVPAFITGTVIVVDPATVITQNLPPLPNVIRSQGNSPNLAGGFAGDGMTGARAASQYETRSGNFSPDPARNTTRSVTHEWSGPAGATKYANRAQELPEPANPVEINPEQINPSRAGSPPMLAIPGVVPQPASALPNPTQPFLDVPASDGRGAENLAPPAFPAPGMGSSANAEPMPLIPIIEAGATEVPVPDPRAEPLPDEDPELTAPGSYSKIRKWIDLTASVTAGLLTLVALAVWLQRRMNAKSATVEESQTTSAASELVNQSAALTASEASRGTPVRRPVAPPARTPATRNPATKAPAAGGHPLPRPHFAQAPTPIAARTSPGAAPYDVVMPPEPASTSTKNLRQSPIPAPSAGPATRNAGPEEKPATSGLLDRVLASVHGSRLR